MIAPLTSVAQRREVHGNSPHWTRSVICLTTLIIVLPTLALAQSGSPFDSGFNSLQNLFTGTIAKVASLIAIVIGGYMFAHGEPGAKRSTPTAARESASCSQYATFNSGLSTTSSWSLHPRRSPKKMWPLYPRRVRASIAPNAPATMSYSSRALEPSMTVAATRNAGQTKLKQTSSRPSPQSRSWFRSAPLTDHRRKAARLYRATSMSRFAAASRPTPSSAIGRSTRPASSPPSPSSPKAARRAN